MAGGYWIRKDCWIDIEKELAEFMKWNRMN